MNDPLSAAQVSNFDYELPESRIALQPVSPRDSSRLLCYKNGRITHHHYRNLPDLLPRESFLVYNDTRVIPARLLFKRDTGSIIEILLLDPTYTSPALAMQAYGTSTWNTMVGNLKKWKPDEILEIQTPALQLKATLLNRDARQVELSWEPANLSLAEVLEETGKLPLPPYLNREVEKSDQENYQTTYAHYNGAVAAPTAGLHFTQELLERLNQHTLGSTFLTLHVGAGTFKPMKSETAAEHEMHEETMIVNKVSLLALQTNAAHLVAVGTTSLRTLESLYWWGVLLDMDPEHDFHIATHIPYTVPGKLSYQHALDNILRYMSDKQLQEVSGKTGLFIVPGYHFKSAQALITNFHQPQSTLLMLVAAWTNNNWHHIYGEALQENYRFLSFGDGSILFRS